MRRHISSGSAFDGRMILLAILLRCIAPGVLVARLPDLTPNGSCAVVMEDGSSPTVPLRRLANAEKEFYSITGCSQESFPPIQIVIHNSSSTRDRKPGLKVDSLEGGIPRIRLDLPDRDDPLAGQYLAIAFLLREYFGSSAPESGTPLPVYPEWVTRGLAPLLLSMETQRTPSGFLAGSAPPSLEGFLVEKVPPMENRTLVERYDALSSALVKAGFKGPGGAAAFRSWIGRADPKTPPKESPPPWILGWEMRSVERRWILLLAGASSASVGVVSILPADASFREYGQIMDPVREAGGIATLAKGKGGEFNVTRLSERLTALRLKSNPLVNPLLDRAIQLLSRARKLSEKKIRLEEEVIANLRADTESRIRSIGEYLDWYEAARVPVKSGLFDHLADPSSTTVRKGPVGRYLDAVEQRGW